MPNHITNRLEIIGTPEQIKTVLDYIRGEEFEQFIDFDKVVPQPKEVIDSLESNERHPLWDRWRRENWGCKWNAYSQIFEEENNAIEFYTANMPSLRVTEALAMRFPNVIFDHMWCDEDIGTNCGHIHFDNENPIAEFPVDYSVEAYEIIFKLCPAERDEYKLVDGEYVPIGGIEIDED